MIVDEWHDDSHMTTTIVIMVIVGMILVFFRIIVVMIIMIIIIVLVIGIGIIIRLLIVNLLHVQQTNHSVILTFTFYTIHLVDCIRRRVPRGTRF